MTIIFNITFIIFNLFDFFGISKTDYSDTIRIISRIYGINENLACIVAYNESRFIPDIVSKTDDYGLFQVHCGKHWSWCRKYSINKNMLLNPYINIFVAMSIMRDMKTHWIWCKKHVKRCPVHWLYYWNSDKRYIRRLLRGKYDMEK